MFLASPLSRSATARATRVENLRLRYVAGPENTGSKEIAQAAPPDVTLIQIGEVLPRNQQTNRPGFPRNPLDESIGL